MDKRDLEQLLSDVAGGAVTPADALTRIQTAPTADLGFAQLDLSRGVRQGAGEVVYGAGKTADQIAAIIEALRDAGQERILVTRLDAEKAARTAELLGNGIDLGYVPDAQLALVGGKPSPTGNGRIVVACAGTSDLPVAEKAIQTLKEYGIETEIRVLSAHRCPNEAREFAASARESGFSCIIALAGMAAHLAGAMAANTTLPVIGVPCSGAKLDGMDALLSTVQMPSGIPVATVAIDGAKNAAILAVQIMAVSDEGLAHKLQAARDEGTAAVLKADEELRERYKN